MGKVNSFEDLIVWQKAQELAVKVYKLANEDEFIKKDITLRNQLKSAAMSISDNVGEGFEYNNNPDFHRFLRMAKGSCGEIRNKILFLVRMVYITENYGTGFIDEIKLPGSQIGQLIKSVKAKMTTSKK